MLGYILHARPGQMYDAAVTNARTAWLKHRAPMAPSSSEDSGGRLCQAVSLCPSDFLSDRLCPNPPFDSENLSGKS